MNEHADYDEFVVQIGPRNDAWHPVTVLRSPAGTGGNGRFPVRDFLHDTSGTGESSVADGPARGFTEDAEGLALPSEVIGRSLFDALFTGDVLALFERSLGRASAQNRRLRVRLHLNVENPSIAPLARLPWELMFRQDRRAFLALSPDTTFVRSLDVPIDAYDLKIIAGPVKVLFVMANPRGDLNLKAERVAIEQQIASEAEDVRSEDGSPSLAAEFLENATFAALEEKLHRKDFHIIHFMGHGATSADGEGQLLFNDGTRSGRDFGELLKNEPMVRLVTLNACNTAATSIVTGADPFAGVATALVIAGVPAVIAMQFPVSDSAAIAFSARLYSEIGMGRSIESSVDSGRRKIKALRPGQHEWATPVLFLRDPALTSAFRSGADRAAVRNRTPAPTGDVIAPRGFAAMPNVVTPAASAPVMDAAKTAAKTEPAAAVAPAGTTAARVTPHPAALAKPQRGVAAPPTSNTKMRIGIGIGVAAAAALLLAMKVLTRTDTAAAVTDSVVAVPDTARHDTLVTRDTGAHQGAVQDSATTDSTAPTPTAAAGDGPNASPTTEHARPVTPNAASDGPPIAQIHFLRRGVTIDVLSSELGGTTDTIPTVAAGAPITVTVRFRVTRTRDGATQCGESCPLRLYLLLSPTARGSANPTCVPSVIEDTTDGGVRTFTTQITAPDVPDTYGVTFGTSLGTDCTREGIAWFGRTTFSDFTVK